MWLCPGFGLGCAWSQASYFFHEVQAGETLWSISKAYGISVERLRDFNGGLQISNSIKAGEFLIVPADVLERPQRPAAPKNSGEGNETAVLPASVFGGEATSVHQHVEPPLPELALVSPVAPELALVSPVEADKPQKPHASAAAPAVKPTATLTDKPDAKPGVKSEAKSAAKPDAKADSKTKAKPKADSAAAAKPKASESGRASRSGQAKNKPKAGGKGSGSSSAGSGASGSQSKNSSELAYNSSSATAQTVSGGRWKRGHAPKAADKGKGTADASDSGVTKTKTPEEMVAFAKKFLGTPYVYGGDTPAGFDCSGFVQSVCRYAGVNIPRVADDQYYRAGKPVPKGEERQGDLVFFETDPSWPGPSHVGICLGNGEFIHASSSGSVRINSLSQDYYKARFLGSKRVLES